jgi:small subunit ribosomal protein S11
MAEEKSGPAKEKSPKPAAAPEGAAPAEKKPAKGAKSAAPAADAAAPAAAPAAEGAAAAPAKPVELVGGVARQPTAEELLKEELGAIKIRKAKGCGLCWVQIFYYLNCCLQISLRLKCFGKKKPNCITIEI